MPRRTKPAASHSPAYELPDSESLRAYMATAKGRISIRDVARAFNLPPESRAALRKLMAELAVDSTISQDGRLPEVMLVEILGFDNDGYGLAQPVEQNNTDLPLLSLQPARGALQKAKTGDRALVRPIDAEARDRTDKMHEVALIRLLPKRTRTHLFGEVVKGREGLIVFPADKGPGRPLKLKSDKDQKAKPGDLVEVEVIEPAGRMDGLARLVRVIGRLESPAGWTALAVAEFGLRAEFDSACLEQAEQADIPELGKREDLRDLDLVTIDGADAKDFDDAVWAIPSETGGWHIKVAIADVSAYVAAGSALDKEAEARGNSVYLPGTVIPMLPEALSNGLCSLRPDEDRACMVAHIEIDSHGQKKSHHFSRALMRSSARLTYEKVQKVLDGLLDEADLEVPAGTIHHLSGAYHLLKEARDKRGTLNLHVAERVVELDKNNKPVAMGFREPLTAHQLIEEFMILANVCAAETLEKAGKICVYRVHDQPDPEKLEALHDLAETIGLSFPKGQRVSPHRLNSLLAQVAGKPEENMVNDTVLRCQSRAVYHIDNIGHYGLSLAKYAHFTSPIRRYADLLVHRALVMACDLGPERLGSENRDTIAEVCTHISQTEQSAARAERRTMDRLAASLYQHRRGESFDATITGLNKAGLFVSIEGGRAEGFVPRRTLPEDRYELDESGLILQGKYEGWCFQLGMVVHCRLERISLASGGLDFSWVSGGTRGATGQKTRRVKSRFKKQRGRKRR